MRDLKVRDYMQTQFVRLQPGMPLLGIVRMLHQNRALGAPVVAPTGELLGYVSEQDCIKALLDASYFCESNTLVDDVMQRAVLTVKPDDSIVNLAEQMLGQKPKRYPVVDGKRLVGLIARSDVLRALESSLTNCQPV